MGNNKIITPYHGEKPYIFVSYSHRNVDDAMEIVNQLQSNCYRVWYDEGIDPGSEWDENIASHVESCGFFIALLSQEYLSSSNCKDELNYARDLEKPRLLIYLDDIQLPGGMQMRLSRLQAIHKYRYDDQESFYEKLYASKGIDTCLGVNELEDANNIIREKRELINPDAPLRLICVFDTSASMAGERIDCLNEGLKRVQSSLLKKYGSELAVDILQYDTSPQWRTFSELPIKASGTTNVGEALKALQEYGNKLPDNCSCALVFSSDGWPTDLYGDIQQLLQQEKWFHTAVKIGIAISKDASTEMLANVIGSQSAVVTVEKVHLLPELFETLAVTSVKATQKNNKQKTNIEGRDIVDWIDNELVLLQKAENGDAEAQYLLGEAYSDKNSIFKDHKKAFEWFLKSAENGYVKGMLRVAALYHVGLGCKERDTYKVQYWYRRAMEEGSSIAVLKLAEALDQGFFDHGRIGKSESDKQEALELYKKASELGYVEGSRALAFYYHRDNRDSYLAFYWFRVGAEQGDSESQLYYASALFHGNAELDIKPQKEEAVIWYSRSAEQGNVLAQYALSKCLFYGEGIEKSEKEAFVWCEKAARQNMRMAQETLSIMYGRGLGIEQDSNKCEYWYRVANELYSADSYKKVFFSHVETLSESYPVFDSGFDW